MLVIYLRIFLLILFYDMRILFYVIGFQFFVLILLHPILLVFIYFVQFYINVLLQLLHFWFYVYFSFVDCHTSYGLHELFELRFIFYVYYVLVRFVLWWLMLWVFFDFGLSYVQSCTLLYADLLYFITIQFYLYNIWLCIVIVSMHVLLFFCLFDFMTFVFYACLLQCIVVFSLLYVFVSSFWFLLFYFSLLLLHVLCQFICLYYQLVHFVVNCIFMFILVSISCYCRVQFHCVYVFVVSLCQFYVDLVLCHLCFYLVLFEFVCMVCVVYFVYFL